ncbi:MlaD family protein [Nocardia stercoris]|nr:MlaD family protein [Nocardia stercoris]
MPGVAVDRRRSLLTGTAALALAAAVAVPAALYLRGHDSAGLTVALHTTEIGDGILEGTPVREDGVQVGTVTAIAPDRAGTQRITLRLDAAQLRGLDESLQVDYAPSNLFGIGEIELRRGPGGAPLRQNSVVDLTGPRANGVFDATMSGLLRSLAQTGDSVLTPQMVSSIAQAARDLHAFTPLLQALISVAGTVTDHQIMPSSELAGRLGTAFDGGGKFAAATIHVLDLILRSPALQENRAEYDAAVAMLTGQLLPGLARTAGTAGDGLSGSTDALAPVLDAVAATVPQPGQSGAQLSELLDRLRAAMPDTPNGPVLNAEIDVHGMPILAPMLGGNR